MANLLPTPTLTAIAAAQAERPIYAFDRAEVHRTLPRLQRIYAAKLAQFEAVAALFDEAEPDLVLQVPSHQLTLRLGAAVNEVYPVLRHALDQELRGLEGDIVNAHLAIEQDAQYRAGRPTPELDEAECFIPYILALCQPTPTGLSREQITQREAVAHARADAEAAIEEPDSLTERSRAAHELGSQCLWHANFPAGLVHYLAHTELFRITADLPHDLRTFNGGQPLDAYDYAYVADVLRAALAGTLTTAHRLRLERALTWVEATALPA